MLEPWMYTQGQASDPSQCLSEVLDFEASVNRYVLDEKDDQKRATNSKMIEWLPTSRV